MITREEYNELYARYMQTGICPAELEPYRVNNLVIMAAGLSSRFTPLSLEKPKGLLKVRGDVLIERIIQQAKEAGIQDIAVVVGYKKELFAYLQEQYKVQIIENNEYALRNNHSSIYAARSVLGNSYICPSDIYFVDNPFKPYLYCSSYSALFSPGQTTEWCLELDAHDRIVGVTIGGENSWYMNGDSYLDRSFSKRLIEFIDLNYNTPEIKNKYWENIFIDHIDELYMEARKLKDGVFFEFDTFAELKAFDPDFLEHNESTIVNQICAALSCHKAEIQDICPLNRSDASNLFRLSTGSGEYLYNYETASVEAL